MKRGNITTTNNLVRLFRCEMSKRQEEITDKDAHKNVANKIEQIFEIIREKV